MSRISVDHRHQHHRRGRSLTGVSSTTDENLDLFSRNRRTLSLASSDESEVSMKLGRVSVGSVKLPRCGMDDLLSSVDGGKNDYDWLLTPPGTPLVADASEHRPHLAPARNSTASSVRAVTNSKASRLSVTQSDNSNLSRPTRSSSVTRSSTQSTNYNTYSPNFNRSSILNTSSASITSIARPSPSMLNTSSQSVTSTRSSTPNTRSTLTSTRPSTPTSRVPSRPSTPVRSRPTPSSTYGDKTRAPQNQARPLTPTSRSQTPTNSTSSALRSRPSTPTRRSPGQTQPLLNGHSISTGRAITSGRNSAPVSRGSSPGPRPRPPPQPIVPPDFPVDTPPNLRTTMPERPVSAGRSRPSTPVSVRGNSEPGLTNPPRRQSSPIVTRGRLPDSGKGRSHSSGYNTNTTENQKTPPNTDSMTRRAPKSATSSESTGFGRTLSKKSLDMALRHMDIRHSSGSIRSSPGSTLFPQSIRPGTVKGNSARVSDVPLNVRNNEGAPDISSNNNLDNRNCNNRSIDSDGEYRTDFGRFSARVSETDLYESSRYDAILLKEEKNTNWLLSLDDKFDQGSIFDHRFEPLPEPFDPL